MNAHNSPMTLRSVLEKTLVVLRGVARGVGRFFAVVGWLFFIAGLFVLFEELAAGRNVVYGGGRACLITSGLFLVPTWFMLRFAAGVFPFGKRMH